MNCTRYRVIFAPRLGEGRTPPKTKKIDIILRVAASIHVFNHVATELLQRQPTSPAEEIEKETLLRAIEYVGWAESQKEIFVEFLNDLMSPTMDETKTQPSGNAIKNACLLFGGPLLTFRAFKQSGPRSLRGIAVAEFNDAIKSLERSALGKVRRVNVRYATGPITVFVKEDPDKVVWPNDLCAQTDYRARYHQQVNKTISVAVRRALIDAEFVPQGMFPDLE